VKKGAGLCGVAGVYFLIRGRVGCRVFFICW